LKDTLPQKIGLPVNCDKLTRICDSDGKAGENFETAFAKWKSVWCAMKFSRLPFHFPI
jgi:hypothetical protein